MNAKERILDSARRLLNKNGLQQLTARTICSDLGISPGSFSYHFPDKKTIVSSLYDDMRSATIEKQAYLQVVDPTIIAYLQTQKELFGLQEHYRFFYLNLSEVMQNHVDVTEKYREHSEIDREMTRQLLRRFQETEILKKIEHRDLNRIDEVGSIVKNSWLVEKAFSVDGTKNLKHYLQLYCGLIEPYLHDEAWQAYHAYFTTE